MIKVKLETLKIRKCEYNWNICALKETPVDLVRVAPAVAEAGLLPLGTLTLLPCMPCPQPPPWQSPGVPATEHSHSAWPDLRVPVLRSHSGIRSKSYWRACQKENKDFFFFNRWIFGKPWKPFHWRRRKKVVPLATGLSANFKGLLWIIVSELPSCKAIL